MTDAKGDKYLTPAQAATILHVSPKTVTRWAIMGHLRCVVTLGGHRRFRRRDVEEILGHMAGKTRHEGSAREK